jgi:SAM-dependent methyltransferase
MRILSEIKYIKALRAILTIQDQHGRGLKTNTTDAIIDNKQHLKAINRALVKTNLTNILDCGCGTYGPEFFKSFENVSYTGIDLIRIPSIKNQDKNFMIYRSDIERPIKAIRLNKYSLILAINSIETTTRPWQVIQQVTRMLKPNGICVIIFNQYEGSFLITGNPFTLESLIRYCRTKLVPISGEVFVALDSPTRRDYLIILRKKRKKYENDKQIGAEIVFSSVEQPKLGETIAHLEFSETIENSKIFPANHT